MTLTPSDPNSFSPEWRRWIVENRMQGLDEEKIVSILLSNDFSESEAREALQRLDDAQLNFLVGKWNTQRLKKLESILTVQRAMASLSPVDLSVPRKRRLPRDQFLEQHYSANKPVIFVELMDDWPALRKWTPDYLKSKCGDLVVEVMTGREQDENYEINMASHRTTMSFKDFVDRVFSGESSNDFYMTGNNHFLKNPAVSCLVDDLKACSEYLKPEIPGYTFFWFGPTGTVTQPHHDELNILMAQVLGSKRITLVSPDQTHLLYNNVGVYSDVNWQAPDYGQHPLFTKVQSIDVTLLPGEMLFIPVGWWHYVRALEPSITVSFSNFVFPNHFQYMDPEISG